MATFTVDFFTSLDGNGSARGWPGYWGKEGPELREDRVRTFAQEQVLVFGATTFREFREFVVEYDEPYYDSLNSLPKIVFSRTLREPLGWANSTLIAEDAVTAVERLKRETDVPMRSHGSITLNRALLAAGLVDRLEIMVFPAITGRPGEAALFERRSGVRPGARRVDRARRSHAEARVHPARPRWGSRPALDHSGATRSRLHAIRAFWLLWQDGGMRQGAVGHVRVVERGGRPVVEKRMTDPFRHDTEVLALRALEATGIPAPELIDVRPGSILMTLMPGERLDSTSSDARLAGLRASTAVLHQLHALRPPAGLPPDPDDGLIIRRYRDAGGPPLPLEIPPPPGQLVFCHGDWTDGKSPRRGWNHHGRHRLGGGSPRKPAPRTVPRSVGGQCVILDPSMHSSTGMEPTRSRCGPGCRFMPPNSGCGSLKPGRPNTSSSSPAN